MKNRTWAKAQSGVGLIEILVTLLILLLGLLGLAGLQIKAQAADTESYQRVQALVLLRDMADRINANRGAAADYITAVTAPVGRGSDLSARSPTINCAATTSTAQVDLCDWDAALKGAAESAGGTCDKATGANCVGAMIAARGCITSPAANQYLIQVVWQGLVATSVAPASVACGSGSYDAADLTRRAVTTLVQIGTPSLVPTP